MTAAMTTLKEWEDRYMELVDRIEEPVLEYTGRVADTVAEYVPERPSWEVLDRLPTLTEFVDHQLKFRKRVVDEQAAFVRKLMKAAHPALVKLEKPTSVKAAPVKPAAARTPRASASKTARKPRARAKAA